MNRWLVPLFAMLLLAACGTTSPGGVVRIGVPPGASLGAVGDSLVARGILANRLWFTVRGRLRSVDRSLKAGIYEFTPGSTVDALLDRLVRGDAVSFNVTLPEGATIFDLARRTEAALGIPADSMLAALRDTSVLARFGIRAPSAEGWLLPTTYDFGGYSNAREVARRFLTGRQESWPDGWQQQADAIDLDQADILTLASIVEGEAQLAEELPLIAAVYRNRLRLGMPLQADPTIQYAYLLDTGARKPRLFNSDYAYQSPYNTYLFKGLPPTPIGNPTTAAIAAVLSPANVPHLYFVARGDGGHIFAKSSREHVNNIRRVRGRQR
ncbi:MAG: endolytic transglycosylase MltG [Gemmatimonadales bacterium]|nr:endolytic transglycosylase MltG [Gemmatimonadales bacterium]